jgi:NadR type nicotinamide-nucleotide adenylyltransferase
LVTHYLVDIERTQIPVSATLIRHNRDQHQKWLADTSKADYLVQSICLLGAESTGKSTLSKAVADQLNEPLCEEFGRELWQKNEGKLTKQDYTTIVTTQCQREDIARSQARHFICCDTSPLTTLFYFENAFNYRPDTLNIQANRAYSHVYLCSPDFLMVQDGTRQDENFRQRQHEWYVAELKNRSVRYQLLNGSFAAKVKTILTDIQSEDRLSI